MAFGYPRPSVSALNVLIVLAGLGILLACSSWHRWIGVLLILWGLLAGLIMGSWSQLLQPFLNLEQVGHRDRRSLED